MGASIKAKEDPFNAFDKPGHIIRRLQQIAVQLFLVETSGSRLTPTQYVSMLTIADRPGLDQATLSDLTAIDRSMTARNVDALAKRKLINKVPGKEDRRANNLRIAAPGSALLKTVGAAAERSQDKILAPLSKADQREFFRIVGILLNAHELSGPRPRPEQKPLVRPSTSKAARPRARRLMPRAG